SNAIVSPGSSPGIFAVTNSAQLNPSAVFQVELNGLTAGTGYDQLAVGGQPTITNATLSPTLGFASNVGDTFTILDNRGSLPVIGTFAGLPEGSVLAIGGKQFRISYIGGTGNDITLQQI